MDANHGVNGSSFGVKERPLCDPLSCRPERQRGTIPKAGVQKSGLNKGEMGFLRSAFKRGSYNLIVCISH